MARQFGKYSPRVPLGTTWEEAMILEDAESNPIDLTGYKVIAQLYYTDPLRDPTTGKPLEEPILEITTPGFHVEKPTYSVEGFSIPDPTTGEILLTVDHNDFWHVSPTNEYIEYVWAVMLVGVGDYRVPVIRGTVKFLHNGVIV